MKLLCAMLLPLALAYSAAAGMENFDEVKPGALPAGWTSGVTGDGESHWEVVPEATSPSPANVLKQSGAAKYCWCVNTNVSLKNGLLEVRFKPMFGTEDESGGLIWRFQNAGNYYVARANALENNVTIYKTVNGVRTEYGRTRMRVTVNQWHTLRVDFSGPHFTVAFDNDFALAWDDDTFAGPGNVGVWTKADSTTLFDDFHWDEKPGN